MGDIQTGLCNTCTKWKEINVEGICCSCYTNAYVGNYFSTCDTCGRASETDPCLNCNNSSITCYRCDRLFEPLEDEVICFRCSSSCQACNISLEKGEIGLCSECADKKKSGICTSCGEKNRSLDNFGRCIGCRPHMCPSCKIRSIQKDEFICSYCLNKGRNPEGGHPKMANR